MSISPQKVLTVAVPAYNAEWCLDKCLSSFITEPVLDSIEVIIVNDGSTDSTHDIALGYTEKYPEIFKLIDKDNGGHGSAINAAIKLAAGKYFKGVDADDWVLTENLNAFIDILSEAEADAVITHFRTVDMTSGEHRDYKTKDITLNRQYTLDDFTTQPGDIYTCAAYHALTYRTAIYRESGTELSEGVYYEDQEYATLPFRNVQTVLPLDMFLYEYLVGNENQSVSDLNQVKRLSHVEQLVRNIFRCYRNNPDMSEGSRRYIARKATDLLPHYYYIALIKNPDKPSGRKEAARVRQEMATIAPELVKKTDGKFRMARIMGRLGFTGKTLSKMKRPLPYRIYRKVFKRNRV